LQEEAVEAHESWCDRGKRIAALEAEVLEWKKQAVNNEQLERQTNKDCQTAEYELKQALATGVQYEEALEGIMDLVNKVLVP